ncbi:MAG: hypothetical protein HOA06_10055 [Chloroflexi bacterium]|jgi:hypothetical protein|nr:hypothetical protein [Chloroflexota bacterium]
MSAITAWSYSALNSYETCPHRHYRQRVKKDITEPEGEALKWGNEVHKALELRIRDGIALPKTMQKWEPMVAKLLSRTGDSIAEQELCLNEQLAATGWWDKDAWVRAKVDYMLVDGNKALMLDWKTGKPKPDHDQLTLFAAFVFHHYPQIDTVTTGYVWLAHKNKISTAGFERSDLPDMWAEFLPRVRRFNIAYEQDKWEKKPSGLCRAWCPVIDCEFNGKNKG